MRTYKCLSKQEYTDGLFKLVPIRDEDKLLILKMRNEQIYHLRQTEELTIELQETYFANIISSLFDQERPSQLLFSLLEDCEFIGYGGLVHINWIFHLKEHEFQQLHSRITKLATAPIFIDDTAGISIFDFRAKCRRLKAQHNIELIIIDYLQLMSAKDGKGGGNREQEISTISRSIKEIAKELNVPIIALSQLSRAVETRKESKMPQLSDLRESGAIEQDADMVMFIYRPEYYEVMSNEMGESTQGETHIRIAKHRNGSLDLIKLRARLDIQRFEEWDGEGGIPGLGSNYKPVSSLPGNTSNDGGRFFIQGSKMNGGEFDEGINDEDQPF